MGMPQIPNQKHRGNMKETIIDLLESIALEEMSLSHILNADGEKLQLAVSLTKEKSIDEKQLSKSFLESNELLQSVIFKEWLLINKLKNVRAMWDKACINEYDESHSMFCEKCLESIEKPCNGEEWINN